MFRFASGLKMSSGIGSNGKGYLILNGEDKSIVTDTKKWFGEKYSDTDRIWWFKEAGDIKTFKKSLDDGIFELMMSDLEKIESTAVHPIIKNGPENEAKRLFPEIDNEANNDFIAFIEFLNKEFNFNEVIRENSNPRLYSEDIGPCMICSINGVHELPPEIPTLYSAPAIWSQLTWWINNHFSGPYPDDPIKFPALNGRRFDWGLLKISTEYKNLQIEGLVYFFLAKFIIVHDAWAANNACESLRVMIDLIQNNGERPWRLLY
tara:strand:- start:277 stop:1065 length:789 start_codon:yes stop_codon:yes gene_type:complete